MALRYLHKGWKAFWTVILSLLLIVVVVGGGIFGLLQLEATKDTITEKIENDFKKNYHGRLTIGSLEGLLPFNAELHNVVITSTPDSASPDTLLRVERAKVGIDVGALLQKKLSINAFKLDEPMIRLLADGNGSYTISKALKKKKINQPPNSSGGLTGSFIRNIEIIAPHVSVNNGTIFVDQFYDMPQEVNLPEPFRITGINAQMFVELTEAQRFVEMNKFTAHAQGLKAGEIDINGQLYNDDQVLEFNAFHFTAGTTHLHLNGTIDGVDLYRGALRDQLADAQYDIEVSSHRFKLSEFTDVFPHIPDINEPLDFTIETTGRMSALDLSSFRLGVGESYFEIDGEVDHLFAENRLAYNFNIDTLAVRKQDLEVFTGPLNEKQYRALGNLRLNGQARGTADSLIVDVSGSSSLGSFKLDGEGQLKAPYGYRGALTGQGVDIGPLAGARIDTTNLNFSANITGQNTSLTKGYLEFEGIAQNSFINDIRIDNLRLTTSLRQGVMDAEYDYRNQEQSVSGKGTANFNRKDPPITLSGNTQNLNLNSLFTDVPIDSTSLNTDYEIDIQGTDPDRIHGMARFEAEPSVINGDSVQSHHIRVELDSPDLATRTLHVNSSLFDLILTGNLKPSNISNQVRYWSGYFKKRIAEEIRLDTTTYIPESKPSRVEPVQIQGNIEAKNLNLVRQYWPEFPSLVTNSTLNFDVTADASDLLFSSQIQSDTLQINTMQVKEAVSQLSGQFNHDSTLKESGNLDFETSVARFESDLIKMDSVNVQLNYRQDSLFYSQQVKQFSEDARFNLQVRSKLRNKNITVAIDEFFLGNDFYAWQNENTPQLTFNRADEIVFDSFRFKNQNEFFAVQGVMSPDRSDSLQYIIRDVDLGRISELLKGEFSFDGRMNGTLQTRSLSRAPSVQGDLTVNRLELQDRLVGDITFSSRFNENQKRFDTRLEIFTDSTKYQKYIEANEDVGQNIVLDGYFKPANVDTEQDTVFYFDADLKEIDMWAVQLITQNIFKQLEGRATGEGTIAGNLNDVNFDLNFQVHDVYARPQFLNTNYYLDGPVAFNSEQGLVLKDIDIRDNKRGTGTLSGTVDLNDFKPITFLDLRMELNNLQFLNNSYDPEVPFYGNMAGTGSVRLSGANTDMLLRSTNDIRVSENSTLSIPLMDQTEFSSGGNFIQFVDSFENPQKKKIGLSLEDVQNLNLEEGVLEQAMNRLTFNDRFNIDLQFDAPEPINIRLIFDQVTGERMLAEGTGRLRVSMEEGVLQMFGNYNVTGGSYQFVSGDIFSRELEIRPGGNITWEGPPDNARLNIEAVYRARPTRASLNSTSATETGGEGAPQRVPVNLIVEISGTLNSIENEYYFEVPNSFELTSSNSTLQLTLNQINNDDQQKLLQATSVLLTGNFLATGQGANSQTSQLRSELTRGSTFINPILSNQLISPLLSSQINSLLNSDVSQFDIDFQLNQYNQIDLGIALRLYNDKLILRREGYLTGGSAESSFYERIGDLNATYRINPNLSLTAFHRQDQTFSTVAAPNQSTDLTPTVDGIGVEAQVQFNTWEQLGHKVQNFFRRLVGKEEINFAKRERKKAGKKNITEQKN